MNTTLDYAKKLDQQDPLKAYRNRFLIPQHEGQDCIYLCGNSLGLQPKATRQYLLKELDQWEKYGVEGHFKGEMPWMYYHKFFAKSAGDLVGAKESEVVIMNTLTTNLHLMMVSFYQPKGQRNKIIIEGGAFPSDQYAMESQARFHGLNPEDVIIELQPREGEHTLRTEDILATIDQHRDDLALVMMGGVNYYTGQLYDMKTITKAAHKTGAFAGFDLAHAAGNVPLELHGWGVDFAVWCSYKYLNSGPGGPAGIFVHEKHGNNPDLPRFAGWWGHNEAERFEMKKGFIPMQGAAGWQLSNAQIFAMAAHKASLDIFAEVGMKKIREKSEKLTTYLSFLLADLNAKGHEFNVITPTKMEERGAQFSIFTNEDGKNLHFYLTNSGVISDWREPNVIRIAPVPLYNYFTDIYKFFELLSKS